MITELYEALLTVNIPEIQAKKAAEAVEKNIVDNSELLRQNFRMEEFRPIERDIIEFRTELKFIGERMKLGFEESDKKLNLTLAEMDKRMNLGFSEMDKRMNLGFAEMDKRMKLGFEESDKKLNLTLTEMGKRFQYVERLQLAMLSCLIGLLIKFLFFS